MTDRGSLSDHRDVLRELWRVHRSGLLASNELSVRVLHLLEEPSSSLPADWPHPLPSHFGRIECRYSRYRAACTCGWAEKPRKTWTRAHKDLSEHEREAG